MMGFIDPKYLTGGPDILRYGSMTHQRMGAGKVSLGKAFIYTKFPNDEGSYLTLVPSGEGHEKITEKPEVIKAMFGPKAEEMEKLAKDPYYSGPSIRTLAQQEGNIFGRSGYIKGAPVIMLWNIPASSGHRILKLTQELEFLPAETILVHNTEELGFVRDFVGSGETESMEADPELERLHTATGLEKQALQKQLGRTADIYAKHGEYPDVEKLSDEELEKYPWLKKHYWDKGKELGDPYLGKYQEHMSFQDYVKMREKNQ